MSSPYPPQAPKRLERSKSNRVLGWCLCWSRELLNMDPTLVRVLTVVILTVHRRSDHPLHHRAVCGA
jgi:hypothetical protein